MHEDDPQEADEITIIVKSFGVKRTSSSILILGFSLSDLSRRSVNCDSGLAALMVKSIRRWWNGCLKEWRNRSLPTPLKPREPRKEPTVN